MFFSKPLVLIFLLGPLFWALTGQARVFDFAQESVAPYINFRGGVSSMGATPYQWQSASTYSGDKVDLIYGGEFGIYLRGSRFGVALGLLVHTFDAVAGGRGLDASGTPLYTTTVEGVGYGPQVTFDYQISSMETYIWKVLVGGGYLSSKIESTYSMTATGQPLVGGQSSFTESYKQESLFAMFGMATEFTVGGTTTLTVTAGYHHSLGGDWKYGQGGENLAGSHSQGGKLLFEDGSAKNLDWSYAFVQVGFNIYVDTVR